MHYTKCYRFLFDIIAIFVLLYSDYYSLRVEVKILLFNIVFTSNLQMCRILTERGESMRFRFRQVANGSIEKFLFLSTDRQRINGFVCVPPDLPVAQSSILMDHSVLGHPKAILWMAWCGTSTRGVGLAIRHHGNNWSQWYSERDGTLTVTYTELKQAGITDIFMIKITPTDAGAEDLAPWIEVIRIDGTRIGAATLTEALPFLAPLSLPAPSMEATAGELASF